MSIVLDSDGDGSQEYCFGTFVLLIPPTHH